MVKKVIIKKKKGSILTIKENYKRKAKTMKAIAQIALVLIIIGAINWGLIGIFEFDLVAAIFGQMSMVSRVIYSLVGISGLWGIKLLFDRD